MNSNSATLNTRSIFGSFKLCDEEFAISADSIREVINEPDQYSALPLAPYYLLGLFNLRGIMIPVIDLKKILNLSDTESDNTNEKKISIVECGNFCVGLLFDKTGEVFNGGNSKKIEYISKESSSEKEIVKGLFKLDNAKRIIQILDPLKLKDIKDLAKIQKNNISQQKQEKIGSRKQCISFKKDGALCAFSINDIQEVVRCEEIGHSPQAGGLCLGVIRIRDETLPVIDLSEILAADDPSLRENNNNQTQPIIIMEIDSKLFGLPVDTIENIIVYKDDDFKKLPIITKKNRALIDGCITPNEKENIIILNKEELLNHSQVKPIIEGFYKTRVDITEKQKKIDTQSDQHSSSQSERKTYITFTLGKNYALNINQIDEIIERPENIIRPPSSSKDVFSLIESRGTIIPIIHPELLDIIEYDPSDFSKIIIIKLNNVKCGFMVNTVNSIETFADKEKYKIPHLIRQKDQNKYISGTEETFRNTDGSETNLYLMNIKEIAQNVDLNDVNWVDQ